MIVPARGLILLILLILLASVLEPSIARGQVQLFPTPTKESTPTAIALGPDRNVWFTETEGNRIGRITPRGKITEYRLPQPDSAPQGIAPGIDGRLWFTLPGVNRIGAIDIHGKITEYDLPTVDALPIGLTLGPAGGMWFTDAQFNNLGMISPSGHVAEFHLEASKVRGLYDITVGPEGELWFTENEPPAKVGRLNPDGEFREFRLKDPDSMPFGIAAGPDGHLWVGHIDDNKVTRVTRNGNVTDFPLSGVNDRAIMFLTGPDGNLWFSQGTEKAGGSVDGSIVLMTPQGKMTEFPLPVGVVAAWLTFGADGAIWFTDPNAHQIGRFLPPRPGTISFVSSSFVALENDGAVTITVQRALGASGSVGVDYATRSDSATAGTDYSSTTGTLLFANGEGGLKSFEVPILNDSRKEGRESASVDLFNPTGGARLGNRSSASLFILDDDSDGGPSSGCTPNATSLCLSGNRFRIEVSWRSRQGATGVGTARPLSGDTGAFWFFDSANLELVVKVLDARGINGKFWVFYGALSNVEYTLRVTDTETGAVKTYFNPLGKFGSLADTAAFDSAGSRPAVDSSHGGRMSLPAMVLASRVSPASTVKRLDEPISPQKKAQNARAAVLRLPADGTLGPEGTTYDFFPTIGINRTPFEHFYLASGTLDFTTDFRVTFDGGRESLPIYTLVGNRRPLIDESIQDLGDGSFAISFHLTSNDGGDLFPLGFSAPDGTELTDPVLSIGWLPDSDPLDWEPPHRVTGGSLELKRNRQRLVLFDQPPDVFFGGAQWDGNYSTILPGYAGQGIDEVILRAVVEPLPAQGCVATSTALCLSDGRFRVDVKWVDRRNGASRQGQMLPLTGDTGTFWFFDPANTELIVKVLDARGINGHFWVFYGALSDVEYEITVIDTETGATKTYFNPQGRLASAGDTSAFRP